MLHFLPMTEREAALAWSFLHVLTKERFDAIMQVFGSLEEGLKHLNPDLLRSLGCRQDTIEKTLVRFDEFDATNYEKRLKEKKISFLTIADDAYPKSLKEIGDPPPFLYYRGDLSILDQPCIALVGTRDMTMVGKRAAEMFTSAFVRAGMVTVSGLAFGIDAVVARETLHAKGKTVAALGHGLAMMFPTGNTKLAEQIVADGGLLVSEFPLDLPPDKYTFPARNRIIAGLSLGTVVLEAPRGSGAIITAELALEYGRDAFAVPGSPFDQNYAGSNDLIAKGQARLVTTPEEVLTEIGVIAPKESKKLHTVNSPAEEALLNILSSMPQKLDDILEKSRLDAGAASAALTMMELGGSAKNVGAGMWVRG